MRKKLLKPKEAFSSLKCIIGAKVKRLIHYVKNFTVAVRNSTFFKMISDAKRVKSITLFPFSANPDISEKDYPGLEVYRHYLKKSLKEPRIRNIFVVGDFGIGKSSLLLSIEKAVCFFPRHSFLHISLGDYRADRQRDSALIGKSKDTKLENKKEIAGGCQAEQQAIERRLLIQIYSRFHRKDLPASSFTLIQEHGIKKGFFLPLYCLCTVLFITGFVFFKRIVSYIQLIVNHSLSVASDDSTKRVLRDIIDKIKIWSPFIRGLLGLVTILGVCCSLFALFRFIILKWELKAITLKADSIQASYEKESCSGYLDQHLAEIVYCFDRIAKKIHYTVIFEDLERLDTTVCLEVLSRLRDINIILNQRRAAGSKPIRFIYVVNEEILKNLDCTKFSDYILSVYPAINKGTAESIFIRQLSKANNSINEDLGVTITPCDSDSKMDEVLYLIGSCLLDYRAQNSVLNEYSLLLRVYFHTNLAVKSTESQDNHVLQEAALKILAIVAYKYLFPDDYTKIWQGTSVAFSSPSAMKTLHADENEERLLSKLFEGTAPLLTISSLYYLGYSEKRIHDLYLQKLKSAETAKELDGLLQIVDVNFNHALRNTIRDYCDLLNADYESPISNNKEVLKQKAQAILKYVFDRSVSPWDWPFCNTVSAMDALSFLDAFPHRIQDIHRCYDFDPLGAECLFDRCKVPGDFKTPTQNQIFILNQCIGEKYDKVLTVNDRGKRIDLPNSNYNIVQSIDTEVS